MNSEIFSHNRRIRTGALGIVGFDQVSFGPWILSHTLSPKEHERFVLMAFRERSE